MDGRRLGGIIGDTVLAVLAIAGSVCIALVVAALAFNVSIMLFSTGSMGPTIPAGSAALVREIPAADVRLGDVVTVDRPGKLPVTHRVVGIADAPSGTTGHRALTLRGDANPVDDPAPYDVGTVRIVLWAVPGVASVIAWFGDPVVLGGLTVAMSALVLWAFWPRASRRPAARTADEPTSRRAARAARGTAAVVLAATATTLALPAPPAEAAPVEQTTTGRYIRLTTISDPVRMTAIEPGGSADLLIGVRTVEDAPGLVSMSLDIAAESGGPLRLRVVRCSTAAAGGSCDDPQVVIPDLALAGPVAGIPLGDVAGHPGAWFRFAVSLPDATPVEGAQARLTVRADGFGEIVESSGGADGSLAASGVDASARVLLAAGTIAIGFAVAHLTRRSRRRGGAS